MKKRSPWSSPRTFSQFSVSPETAQWWGNPAETTEYSAACSATLIHSDILLTAAHCNGIVNNINVIVGAYYSYSNAQGILRTVVNRAVHPDFNEVTIANDFLVLKLDSPVPIAPVILNGDPNSPMGNENLTIIGVGQMNETGDGSPVLLQVCVGYIDPEVCNENYRNVSTINSTVQMCAGVPGGGKGPCYGDSGGPVVNSNGLQVGVVSAAVGCAEAEYPSISARVSGAIKWIQHQVCALSSAPPSYCPYRPATLRVESSAAKINRTYLPLRLSLLLASLSCVLPGRHTRNSPIR